MTRETDRPPPSSGFRILFGWLRIACPADVPLLGTPLLLGRVTPADGATARGAGNPVVLLLIGPALPLWAMRGNIPDVETIADETADVEEVVEDAGVENRSNMPAVVGSVRGITLSKISNGEEAFLPYIGAFEGRTLLAGCDDND